MRGTKLLQFNVSVVKFLNLWPKNGYATLELRRIFTDFVLVFFVVPPFCGAILGLYFLISDDDYDLESITETLLAATCFVGFFYVVQCFIRNRNTIINLIDELDDFEKFGTPEDLMKTDRKASMLTLFFIIYSIIGTTLYAAMPFVSYQKCFANRSNYMKKVGIPCGLVITKLYFPIRHDFTPRKEIMVLYQILICFILSITISVMTTLLCGILMHITTQLRNLGDCLQVVVSESAEDIIQDIRKCVEYHTKIISYMNRTNKAFGSMMLLHITVTSFVISILCYQVALNDNYTDSLRYGLHLGGWLILLFLVCYNGQRLMDESTAIARIVYSIPWYRYPPKIRRDVLLIMARSQRPLTLNVLNFGVMSLQTFLQIMRTAYSYFMLLVKIRS